MSCSHSSSLSPLIPCCFSILFPFNFSFSSYTLLLSCLVPLSFLFLLTLLLLCLVPLEFLLLFLYPAAALSCSPIISLSLRLPCCCSVLFPFNSSFSSYTCCCSVLFPLNLISLLIPFCCSVLFPFNFSFSSYTLLLLCFVPLKFLFLF